MIDGLKFQMIGSEVQKNLREQAYALREWAANLEKDLAETPIEPARPGTLLATIGIAGQDTMSRAETMAGARSTADMRDAMARAVDAGAYYLLTRSEFEHLLSRPNVRHDCISPLKQ